MRFVCWLMLGMAVALPARADDKLDEAKTHFRAGEALYQLGRYQDAAREFDAGYELAPRPPFLINMGQAYRKLNDLPKALVLFEKYLNATEPGDRRRADVERMVAELREEIAHAPPPAPAVETPVEHPVEHPAPPAAVETVVVVAPPPRKSFARRHWWIFPVAVVAVGAAVGVGVYFGTRPVNRFDCSSTVACIDTTK